MYNFPRQVLVAGDGEPRVAHVPSKSYLVQCSRHQLLFEEIGSFNDGHMRIDSNDVSLKITFVVKHCHGERVEVF